MSHILVHKKSGLLYLYCAHSFCVFLKLKLLLRTFCYVNARHRAIFNESDVFCAWCNQTCSAKAFILSPHFFLLCPIFSSSLKFTLLLSCYTCFHSVWWHVLSNPISNSPLKLPLPLFLSEPSLLCSASVPESWVKPQANFDPF